jgi:hypothetical protein
VICAVPGPLNSGTYRATGVSITSVPRSTNSITAVVVAITLVNDARS